jgi:hypothetical protein
MRLVHTSNRIPVIAVSCAVAVLGRSAAAAGASAMTPLRQVTGEYRSYVSWLEGRAWAEAAEQKAVELTAVPAARHGSDGTDLGAGAAAALALAGGTIVLRCRRGSPGRREQ